MPAIFISHSSLDLQVADDIKAALDRLGFEEAFLDFDKETGIGAGENWEKRLYERIVALPRRHLDADAELARVEMVLRRGNPGPRARQGHFADCLQATW